MTSLLWILAWYGVGLISVAITLWAYFYEDGLPIDENDILMGMIMALLGAVQIPVTLFFLIRWVFVKSPLRLPSIYIRKEK